MIKRIVSLVLTISILSGMTIVLAENEEVTVTSNGIISTENFTEDNVIYNAFQNNNGGVSLYSDTSSAGITADFDIVFGLDMSSDMTKFDYNVEKEWLEHFCALAEQVPEGTRFSNIGEEESLFTEDLNQIINEVKERSYSENNDILNVLDNSMNIFDETSANRNKIVIATTTNISDVTAFETKQEELLNYGIIPFVFILNDDKNSNISNLEYVYQCGSLIELRIALSDLYSALSEFSEATAVASLSMESVASTETTTVEYLSDFRDINKFSNATNKGAMLASILSIYGAVPLRAKVGTNTYDLTEISGEKLDEFMVRNNAEFSNGEDLVEFHTAWDEICTTLESSTYFDAGNQVDTILYNLKRKFPVLLNRTSGHEIITKCTYTDGQWVLYTADNEQIQLLDITSSDKVFDTYEYLTSIVNNKEIGISISNFITELDENGKANIVGMHVEMKYPDNYEMVDEKYPVETVVTTVEYGKNINAEAMDEDAGIEIDTTSNPVILTITRQEGIDNRYIVASSLVTYNAAIPDLCNANKRFRDLLYTDEDDRSVWYYSNLFKLTNLGILNGDENRRFNAENSVTRAEFVTMALRAAEINVDAVGTEQYWAYNLLDKAIDLKMIQYTKEELNSDPEGIGSPNINRGEAAYILYNLFIKSAAEVNVPTTLYDYTVGFSNTKINNWGTAFNDQGDITGTDNEEAIRQMYLNSIIEGFPDDEYKPNELLTRAQCAAIISRCLFDLEGYEETAELNIVDDYADDFESELSTLKEGVSQKGCLETEEDVDCFVFVPQKTGSYMIYTEGNTDTYGELYGIDYLNMSTPDPSATPIPTSTPTPTPTMLCQNNDTPAKTSQMPNNINFTVARTLKADEKYYLKVSPEEGAVGNYEIVVKYIISPQDRFFDKQWELLNTGQLNQIPQNSSSVNPSPTPEVINGIEGVDINVLPVWNYTKGEGVTVAVLDTGVKDTHIDFDSSKLIYKYNLIHNQSDVFPWSTEYNDPLSDDIDSAIDGHGTFVAGKIFAQHNGGFVAGVAPGAHSMFYKVVGFENTSSTSSPRKLNTNSYIEYGINEAIKRIPVDSSNASQKENLIINMSLQNYPYSGNIEQIIKNRKEILFVTCAGNESEDLDISTSDLYPGKYLSDNLINVASIDCDGNLSDFSNYSSKSDYVQIAAPGRYIFSLGTEVTKSGVVNDQTNLWEGTSFAAPMVSGVAALLWSYDKTLTPQQIKNKILNNVTKTYKLDKKVSTSGFLNAWEAFASENTSAIAFLNNTSIDIKEKIKRTKEQTADCYKTGYILVNTNDGYVLDDIIKIFEQYSVEFVYLYETPLTHSYVIDLDSVLKVDNMVDILNSYDFVEYAEPVYTSYN